MRLILFFLVTFSLTTWAEKAPTVSQFVPGNYLLKEGTQDQCSQGRFKYRDAGKYLELGVYHSFSTTNEADTIPSDIPEEVGCNYRVKHSIEPGTETTTLRFEDTLECPNNVVRRTLKKTAFVTKDKITLDVTQQGNSDFEDEETFNYRCVWEIAPSKRGGAST